MQRPTLLSVHILADKWGVLPNEILDGMTAQDVITALAYFRLKSKWEIKEANRQRAASRAVSTNRLI